MRPGGLALTLLALVSAAVPAETISSQRIHSLKQLIAPKKITVGPDDQFQAAVDPSGKYLVFTHRADLVSHLRLQEIASGDVVDLMPLNADSQDSSFASDGRLVFTYYKFNARGDICYVGDVKGRTSTLTDRDIHCLQRPVSEGGSERSSPFWRGADEIGYVVRDINTQGTRIVVENIRSHKQQTLVEGRVWAPSMRSGGRFLVYNVLNSSTGKRTLSVLDTRLNVTRPLNLDLPGVPGFAAIAEDERFIYFSHFLNDTNQDNAIDGGDNAVVFRVSLDQVFAGSAGTAIFPEQLTSVETSCSFPRPFGDSLFVTCAFENALDIYQIPGSGVVPADWDAPTLQNALRSSRSYSERILLLNVMHARLKTPGVPFETSVLSNDILADDTAAAVFYLDRMASIAPVKERSGNALLKLYLQAREAKKAQPPGEVTREFQGKMEGILAQAGRIKDEPVMHTLLRGHIESYLDRRGAAIKTFEKTKGVHRPMEYYLYFQLAQQLFSGRDNLPRLLTVYAFMMKSPALDGPSRVYYGFNALRAIRDLGHDPAVRLAAIAKLKPGQPKDVIALLESEEAVLRMVQTKDEKEKRAQFQKLDTLMRSAIANYDLRKAMNVRAVTNFAEYAEFTWLSSVAANWLRDTGRTDTEFLYAREVVTSAALDQAYGYWAKERKEIASNFFYQGLSLTDDLESHAGYVRSEVERGRRANLDKSYTYLKSHAFVDDNMKFVDALLTIMDHAEDDTSTKYLDQAIEQLESMQLDRNSGVRYLLLGYAYMEKMRRTMLGVEFDASSFQRAHRALMLAYDQGGDNDRIRAAALMDLGLLHQRSGSYGLSAKFFTLRKRLGFEHPDEAARFAWYYSRSLFHAFQADAAAKEIEQLPPEQMKVPLRERLALYQAMSGNPKGAAENYAQVMKSGEITGDQNLAKVNLGYGYALFLAKRSEEARQRLMTSLNLSHKLKALPKSAERALDFEPMRLQLIALGFLGQVGTNSERLAALRERGQLLKKAEKILESWRTDAILNDVHIADFESDQGAVAPITSALEQAYKYAKDNGYLGNAVYRTTVNYLVLASMHPNLYRAHGDLVRDVVKGNLTAMQAQAPKPALANFEQVKLELLWSAYQTRVLNDKAAGRLDAILNSPEAAAVKGEIPGRYAELVSLSRALN